MSKELIVSAGRHETRVAILEDDQVVELFHEREKEYSLAGSIHKGRVTRVLPGMQSAFVDIGLERDAFLYVSDFFEDNEEYDAVVTGVEEKVLKMEAKQQAAPAERPMARHAAASDAPPPEPVATASEAAPETPPAAAAVPQRQERERGGRPERGRRGRRRRGGRAGGGIPESKFFSPHSEEAEKGGAEDAPQAPGGEDFLVLPGESLAKYTPSETEHNHAGSAQANGRAAALSHDPDVEAADEADRTQDEAEPEDAGYSLTASVSWAEMERTPEVLTAEPLGDAAEPEVESEIEAGKDAEPAGGGSRSRDALGSEGEGEGLSASEVTEDELAQEAALANEVPDVAGRGPASARSVSGPGAESELQSGTPVQATAETAAETTEEGPEPARIPTSLTAQLREQGHRYPHRVSRRMRRKMRGAPGGREEQQPATAESRTVAPPPEQASPERAERGEREHVAAPSITDLLKEGQEIVVQIAKEPLGQKGARITSHIALPGRFVVYMPTVEHVGVSRKIPSDEERQRLKRILQAHRQGIPGGFICRTAAEGKSEEELRQDMHFLYNLWLDMRQKAEKRPAPLLLHHDLDLVQRILRDQLTTSFKTIWVDSEELYESILRFVERFQPALIGRVKLYTRSNPIFDEFGVTAEIEKALRPKVWLKSGGYIVINQTEALVAIDINTGKYVGKSNRLEDTIVKINTDAIKEIVRQIRLRDLGGIIVVDFIDMDERRNRMKVMQALEEGMRADRAPYKILQFNDFGLVAITRKRVKQSLERTLCAPCPTCEGAGYIKSVHTVISEIITEAQRMQKALAGEPGNLMLRVNPEVARVLKSNQNTYLQEIEEITKHTVIVKSDPLLHQTKFDLA